MPTRSVSVASVSVLLVGHSLRLDSEKDGETGKPFSNWLAIALDAIVYIRWLMGRSLIFSWVSSALYTDLIVKSWT